MQRLDLSALTPDQLAELDRTATAALNALARVADALEPLPDALIRTQTLDRAHRELDELRDALRTGIAA